ncbi:hypothetical protein AV530_004260 [Patagioenas fasciata monilis]|uniref:Uncharacterized protein n=1 Tax=Patagioenas fasciata monilis TaxID=372326 RepID=A0A1V4K8R9_PATFA|nr:hypothetical protein AV530_004260 [Patagioenas fasciata monilis]
MLVVNMMWLVLEETSPSSSARVDDTAVDVPKETRPILGHLGTEDLNPTCNLVLDSICAHMLNKHMGRWRAAPSEVQEQLCSQRL